MHRKLQLLSFLFVLIPGFAAAQTSQETLNPGDQIRISVWRNPGMSGDFAIAPDGTIIHPLYREVHVTGVPLTTVEERLRTFLTRYETNPQFVIQPLMKIVVGGEVRNPNVLSVPPGTTIGQAIAMAGGPGDRADLHAVRVLRDKQVVPIDLSGPDADAATLEIRSGDQIIIGRRKASALNIISPITSSIAALAAIASIIFK